MWGHTDTDQYFPVSVYPLIMTISLYVLSLYVYFTNNYKSIKINSSTFLFLLLFEDFKVPGENHRPAAGHWEIFNYINSYPVQVATQHYRWQILDTD
jgi:hypothetical protein